MEMKNTGSNAASGSPDKPNGAARWSDPKVVAEAILSGSTPFLVGSDPLQHCKLAEARQAGLNKLVSAATGSSPEAAARWSDPKLTAQILLGQLPLGASGASAFGQSASVIVSGENLRALAESHEGGSFDPAKHPRGGNPKNTGQFSDVAGAGDHVVMARRKTGTNAQPAAAATHQTDGDGVNTNTQPELNRPPGKKAPGSSQSLYRVCFGAGTLVSTEGGLKAIETIVPGEQVHCAPADDPSAPVELRAVVEAYHNPPHALLLVGSEDLRLWTTPNHRFSVEGGGWTPAAKLRTGDLLRTREGGVVPVTFVIDTGDTRPVYNLHIADHHTYFVGTVNGRTSVLVHNDSYSPDTKAFWKGAIVTANAVGLPTFLITWNQKQSTTITAEPAATPGFRTSTAFWGLGSKSTAINFPNEITPRRLDRIGNAGKFNPNADPQDISALGNVYNEAFHAWFDGAFKTQKNSHWLWKVIDRQRQFAGTPADMRLLAEEAMSEAINRVIDALEPNTANIHSIPSYDEIMAMSHIDSWYHNITPGHNEAGGYLEKRKGSALPMTEELYYATIWVLYNGDKDPAPKAKSDLQRLSAMKRFFAEKFRPTWTPQQINTFAP